MKLPPNFVSLHPYFKAHPGKLETMKAGLPAFRDKTATEEGNDSFAPAHSPFRQVHVALRPQAPFSSTTSRSNRDEIFCREGYKGAEALLRHLQNVGPLLGEALKIADLIRLEVHGPAAELEKLKGPLAHLDPQWFTQYEANLELRGRLKSNYRKRSIRRLHRFADGVAGSICGNPRNQRTKQTFLDAL